MKQIAQNYKTGELSLLDVPVPSCRPGGVLVRTAYSLISAGTEMMKVSEAKLSLVGKARARPEQLKKVLRSVRQQGLSATYQKVINRLDSYTPLGYSLSGTVVEVGGDVEDIQVGQAVACAGNQYAFHAEYVWVPVNLCASIAAGVPLDQAAFATVGAIALQGMRQAECKLGESACVVGLGLLGQILVRLLHSAGVSVVGVDVVEARCRLAEQAGARFCAAMGTAEFANLPRKVSELTGGHGIDYVFITAGGKDNGPVELAAELARDRARVVDIGKAKLDLPWNAYYEKELEFRFSRSYGPGRYDQLYEEVGIDYPIGYVRWTERRNMECILALLAERRLDLAPLINDVHPFGAAVEVYERINRGELSGVGNLFKYEEQVPLERRLPSGSRTGEQSSRLLRPAAGGIRLGVVGAGNYASSMLLPHLAADADVALVEVVTQSGLSAANAVKKFGFARYSTDSAGLIQADDINAVLIATRHATHAPLVCAALRAGKAVFVEKPLATTTEFLDEILRTIAESGNDRLMVGFNRRFAPLLNQLKSDWGKRSGPHVLHYRINAGPLEKGSWYSQSETEGTRFVGEGGHFIDTASWWLEADPVNVTATTARGDRSNLVATLSYPDGSIAVISYMTEGDAAAPKERIEIFGDGKTALFDNFGRFELWSGTRSVVRRARGLDKGQKQQLRAFIAAIKNGTPMPITVSSLAATTDATLEAQSGGSADRLVNRDYLQQNMVQRKAAAI
jgi:predicted dehydrogenase/threonine dehydrogenase-like Zn-dependent dehydrogenase